VILFVTATASAAGDEFQTARPGRVFSFPRDHGAHPEFKTEWWYWVGHLKAGGGRAFGYQLTFFRAAVRKPDPQARSAWSFHTAYFAHLALTDPQRGTFLFREQAGRGALGLAGAEAGRLKVWVDSWQAEQEGEATVLSARAEDLELHLTLQPAKPPALHGEGGFSPKAAGGGHASHYYSLTRLTTKGKLLLDGKEMEVTGLSWMDHEFFTGGLAPGQAGWDWFALQLDDGSEVMLYLLRHRDGKLDPASAGTLVDAEGRARALKLADFQVKATGSWTSPHTGGTYPSGWEVALPGAGYRLTLSPTLADQEVRARGAARVNYWEGEMQVRGEKNGQPLTGQGYVELTGYAGPMEGMF
jgi:predicted secreted hydrolase